MPSEFRKHFWAAHKEMLLAARSIIDLAVERVEKPVAKEVPKQPEVKAADDFTAIRGIGSAMQARLKQAGVMTYARLATLTPEQIAEITGRSAHRIANESWIPQARNLAPHEEGKPEHLR